MASSALTSALNAASARYPDMVKTDVLNALQTFRDLHPISDRFTFSDNVTRPVVALSGTVPMLHKRATYNIPICLYLLDTHPYHPPICYVRPTPEMMIKPSQHVDTQGRIYLPYLSEWQYGKCDLLGLLQIMVMVFQDNCPVFARGSGQQQQSPATPYPPVGSVPYPTSAGYNMPTPNTAASSAGGSYPYPAYNQQQGAGNTAPYPTSSTTSGAYPYSSYPAYPSQAGSGMSQSQSANSFTNQTSTGSSSSGTIQPEHIRASLLSAVEDRIRRRLYENLSLEYAELQSIRKTREDLNAGEKRLKAMLQKLQTETSALQNTALGYRDKMEEIDKILTAAPRDEELSIDDAVDTTAPLYRQIVTCFVKDSAIEDAIYYYGQALKKGQINLDVFLKTVRKLSRDQFMLRATIQKCRLKAGLSV